MPHTALIIVDVQNDFLPPSGSLAVPGGRQVIPVIQKLLDRSWKWDTVIASQDYHPSGHISFSSTHSVEPFTERQVEDARGTTYTQAMWPNHCVVGTEGVQIDREVRGSLDAWKGEKRIVRKGWHRGVEQYSAFEGYLVDPSSSDADEKLRSTPEKVPAKDTELAKYLRQQGIAKVVVTGLATDYCVGATAHAALEAGFETVVVESAISGISEDGVKRTMGELRAKGAKVVGGDEWESELKGLVSA
ncbi:Isochorismatase-like protein [Papiliotrema laurentii]|uniref:nicotinamidase n=1 Tax=Papiliotrema laurentii TaxID=5418 RepID=A0AAD9CWU0_PAPLA|nr:Isochorismatase-like protein [Papiliotrema laurentii]